MSELQKKMTWDQLAAEVTKLKSKLGNERQRHNLKVERLEAAIKTADPVELGKIKQELEATE